KVTGTRVNSSAEVLCTSEPSSGAPSLEQLLAADDVRITDQLGCRPPPHSNFEAENHAFRALARQMASDAEPLLQTLVGMALELCEAGSAGVTRLERDENGEAIFQWAAIAGALQAHVGGTAPESINPCSDCLERGSPQLYSYPARRFTYLQAAEPTIV